MVKHTDGSDEWWGYDAGTTTEEALAIYEEASSITHDSHVGKYLMWRSLWPLPKKVDLLEAMHRDHLCMVMPLRSREGDVVAVQLLPFDKHGDPILMKNGKKRRITIGPAANAVCRLTPLGRASELCLTEGVEDALAVVAHHEGKVAVWAACGTTAMKRFTPPEWVKKLTIYADHDSNGSKAALRCARRVRASAEPRPSVHLLWSPVRGEDPFDLLARGGEFEPVWRDRQPRDYLSWIPETPRALVQAIMDLKPREKWPELISSQFAQTHSVGRKEVLNSMEATYQQTVVMPMVDRPLLEISGLRQEMFTRLEDVLSESTVLFVQGEGAEARVVAVDSISEEQRQRLSEADITVATGQPYLLPGNDHVVVDRVERNFFVYAETARGPKMSNLPRAVVTEWLGAGRQICLPFLRGLAPYPAMRANGELTEGRGYDPRTQFWITYDGPDIVIPERPTWGQAKAALAVFIDPQKGLLRTYPFEDEHHELGAVALMLQLLDRHNHRLAPAWASDAPSPRTGKMHLLQTISLVALGLIPMTYAMSDNREERHKRVTHALLSGSPLVCLDNINGMFDSSDVATYLGEGRCLIRAYGLTGGSQLAINSNTLTFTGNNIAMTNDMQTRTFKLRLDAKMPNPDQRRFSFDPHRSVRRKRAKYLTAALTLLRWAIQSDVTIYDMKGLGAFTDFDKRIRRPLYALTAVDVGRCLEDMRGDDPADSARAASFEVLAEMFPPPSRFLAKDLIDRIREWREKEGYADKLMKLGFDMPDNLDGALKKAGMFLARRAGLFGGELQLCQEPSNGHRSNRYHFYRNRRMGN